jgi:hypothetical protein
MSVVHTASPGFGTTTLDGIGLVGQCPYLDRLNGVGARIAGDVRNTRLTEAGHSVTATTSW